MRFVLTAILCCLPSFANAALVGQWTLQDNAASTTVVAAVGSNGSTGASNTSAMTGTPGPGGLFTRYLAFNGSQLVSVTSGNAGIVRNKANITVACWFQTVVASGTQTLMIATVSGSGNSRCGLFLNSSGQLQCIARAGNGESAQIKTTSSTYSDGNWHHAAAVIDYAADTITLYVDGSSVSQSGTISFTGTASDDSDSTTINLASGASSERFTGKLVDCRFYDSNESANIGTIMAEADSSAVIEPLTTSIPGVSRDPLTGTIPGL